MSDESLLHEVRAFANERLCTWDTRNPNGADLREYQENEFNDTFGPHRRDGCSCDACYYGRHALAERILALLDLLPHASTDT